MSTNINENGLVTFSVKSQGKSISDKVQIRSIQIEKNVNNISFAKLSIIDGNPNTSTFEVSSSSDFFPENMVTIEVGYNYDYPVVFQGLITNQNIKVNHALSSVLEVVCRDMAVKMTV